MHRGFTLLAPEEQEALRREALRAVMHGEKKTHVAARLGVTRQAVHLWVRRFRAAGAAGLEAKPRGRRKIRPLLPWQEEHVSGTILCRPPHRAKRTGSCWTKKAIADFVEDSFGVRLPEWIVSAYLRDWGFSSQRQVRRAFAQPQAPPEALRGHQRRSPAGTRSVQPGPGAEA